MIEKKIKNDLLDALEEDNNKYEFTDVYFYNEDEVVFYGTAEETELHKLELTRKYFIRLHRNELFIKYFRMYQKWCGAINAEVCKDVLKFCRMERDLFTMYNPKDSKTAISFEYSRMKSASIGILKTLEKECIKNYRDMLKRQGKLFELESYLDSEERNKHLNTVYLMVNRTFRKALSSNFSVNTFSTFKHNGRKESSPLTFYKMFLYMEYNGGSGKVFGNLVRDIMEGNISYYQAIWLYIKWKGYNLGQFIDKYSSSDYSLYSIDTVGRELTGSRYSPNTQNLLNMLRPRIYNDMKSSFVDGFDYSGMIESEEDSEIERNIIQLNIKMERIKRKRRKEM